MVYAILSLFGVLVDVQLCIFQRPSFLAFQFHASEPHCKILSLGFPPCSTQALADAGSSY